MLKKLAIATLFFVPAIASAASGYLVAGGAIGSTDMGDIEETYAPPFKTDDDVQRAVIGGGVELNPYLALEAVYMSEVKNKVESDELEHSGLQAAIIGKAPLTPQFSLFGRLSANSILTDYRYDDGVFSFDEEEAGAYLGFGFGADFQVNDQVGFRLQFERIQISDITILDENLDETSGDFDVDQTSLAVKFVF